MANSLRVLWSYSELNTAVHPDVIVTTIRHHQQLWLNTVTRAHWPLFFELSTTCSIRFSKSYCSWWAATPRQIRWWMIGSLPSPLMPVFNWKSFHLLTCQQMVQELGQCPSFSKVVIESWSNFSTWQRPFWPIELWSEGGFFCILWQPRKSSAIEIGPTRQYLGWDM